MFEDIKNKDSQGLPHTTEDMFDDVDPQADAQPPVAKPQAPVSAVLPTASNGSVGPTQPLQTLAELGPRYTPSAGVGWMKKLGIWLLSVGLIAVLGYGGWYAYATYLAPAFDAQKQTTQNPTNTQPTTDTTPITNTNQPADVTVPNGAAPVTPPVIDTDKDGLTDVEESILGADPSSADTDKDGLTDYEEVKIYNTDPLNPDTDNDGLNDREEALTWKTNPRSADTDGDGYQDGEEIRNGYNPLGAGKLVPPEALPTAGTANQPK